LQEIFIDDVPRVCFRKVTSRLQATHTYLLNHSRDYNIFGEYLQGETN